jgi:hypothetical protein
MSEPSKIPESVRLAAEQQGLGRALKRFPDIVTAAAERGLKPLGEPPAGLSPLASPAPIFDPTRFESHK